MNGLWEWFGDNGGQVSALATVITAAAALAALAASRNESKERTKAQVIAYFDFARHSDETIELIVENIGGTTARDVYLTFDPPFKSAEDYLNSDAAGAIAARYLAPIEVLAPGQALRNPWWGASYPGNGEAVNRYSAPDEVEIKIKFDDGVFQLRRLLQVRERSSTFCISVLPMIVQQNVTSTSSVKGRMKQITEELKGIKDALK